MHYTAIAIAFCLFVAVANCDVVGLGLDQGQPVEIDTINPQNGFNKVVVDISNTLTDFTTPLKPTAYDGNSFQFIIGNSDPPKLALVNTFSKRTSFVELPQYGQLLAFTTYDGFVYTLIGNDPDIPYLGHLVSLDIKTGFTTRLAKVKIDPSQQFKVGAPMIFMPQTKLWVTEIEGSPILLISITNNVSTIYDTQIKGGWDGYWNNVNNNNSFVGYMNGMASMINPFEGNVTLLHAFTCEGIYAVAFEYEEMYHISKCNGNFLMETVDFSNTTTASVKLDSALENIGAIHSSAPYIPYGCGKKCGVNTDCAEFKTCGVCRLGKCGGSGDCGAFCEDAQDCYAGACVGDCEFNRCGRMGCATSCTNHEDCTAVSLQCTVCRLGRCSDTGDCGAYCLNGLDCYGGACVNNCTRFTCSSAT